MLLSATGAIIVPKFNLFINLIGSFACTALAFILPVMMYNKMHEAELTAGRRILHKVLVVFGCVCGAISFVMSVIELAKAFSEGDPEGTDIANPMNSGDATSINLN